MPIVGDLATNVAASLMFEGLRRPLKSLRLEIRRRGQVGQALSDKSPPRLPETQQKIAAAQADLSRIIGNRSGKLTENVANFLRALSRTAIPEAIAHLILCGRPVDGVFISFSRIYDLFEDLPFTAKQIFDGLNVAITIRMESVEDPALLDIVRAQNGEMFRRLDQIVDSLKQYDPSEMTDPKSIDECRVKVAKGIEAANRYVNVETLQGSKKFALKSLAITARLAHLDYSAIESARAPDADVTTPYLNLRRQMNRVVILGDPGGGKSTLTQLLCVDLAHTIAVDYATPGASQIDTRDLRLPLRIVLRSFEARQRRNPAYSIFDYLRDEIRVSLDSDDNLTSSFLRRSLSLGECVLIFDGLDEVLDISSRRNIVTYIEQFSEIYSSCPVLVTSRLVGYRDAPLCDQFEPFALARFNKDEILKYAQKSIRAVAKVALAEAKLQGEEFLRQTRDIGSDIRENPLMLGLMVQIYVFRGDVPSNRPEIYKECALLMFDKWDSRRKILADVPRGEFELLDVFSYVAARVFGDPGREDGVERDWLISVLRENFEQWYINKADARKTATALVDFLTGRAWVMSEVGPGVFKFTHRTFLEYFFARGQISESKDVDELIRGRLLEHVLENEWDVIAHLALQMAVFRDGGKMKQAAETLIELLETLRVPSRQELAFLEFVSKSLEYIIVAEITHQEIVRRLTLAAIRIGSSENITAINVIHRIVGRAKARAKITIEVVERVFSEAMTSLPDPAALFCLYVLGAPAPLAAPDKQARRRRVLKVSESWGKLSEVRAKFKARARRVASEDPLTAQAYMFVYGEDSALLYAAHGPKLFEWQHKDLSPFTPTSLLLASIEKIVSTAERKVEHLKSPEVADSVNFVTAVARGAVDNEFRRENVFGGAASAAIDDGEVDALVGAIYGLVMQERKMTPGPEELSAALVCLFMLTENMSEARVKYGAERTVKNIKGHHVVTRVAPIYAMRSLVERLESGSTARRLNAWLVDGVMFSIDNSHIEQELVNNSLRTPRRGARTKT